MDDSDQSNDQRSIDDRVIQSRYDWSSTCPSTAVVETVATATDRDPVALDPLYAHTDPDALDSLIRKTASSVTDGDTTVSFSYADYDVTVHGSGITIARPLDPGG